MSIGFGLSPFRRPGRRAWCCIAIFGRSPSQRQQIEVIEYTIVRDRQPGSTQKESVATPDRYPRAGGGRESGIAFSGAALRSGARRVEEYDQGPVANAC